LQGLLSKEANIKTLNALGDSSVIVKSMARKMVRKDSKFALIIEHINKEARNQLKVSYLQVLWDLKSKANSYANRASTLKQGVLVKNGGQTYCIVSEGCLIQVL
jgi:hypothetical protein